MRRPAYGINGCARACSDCEGRWGRPARSAIPGRRFSAGKGATVTESMPPPLFDPFAPGFTDDPYPQYATMREQAPVSAPPFEFWLLTGYDDVSWLLRATGLSVDDDNAAPCSLLRQTRYQLRGKEAPLANAQS